MNLIVVMFFLQNYLYRVLVNLCVIIDGLIYCTVPDPDIGKTYAVILTVCCFISVTLCIVDLAHFGFTLKTSRFPQWGWAGLFEWNMFVNTIGYAVSSTVELQYPGHLSGTRLIFCFSALVTVFVDYTISGYDDTYPLRSSKSLTAAVKDIRIPAIILTALFILLITFVAVIKGVGGGFRNRVFMSSFYDAVILVHSQFFNNVELELAKFSLPWRRVFEIYITFIRFIYFFICVKLTEHVTAEITQTAHKWILTCYSAFTTIILALCVAHEEKTDRFPILLLMYLFDIPCIVKNRYTPMKTYCGQAIIIAYGVIFSIPGICALKPAKDAAVPILKIAIQPFKWMVTVICVVPWWAWKVWRLSRSLTD